jgi:hypothetical protein
MVIFSPPLDGARGRAGCAPGSARKGPYLPAATRWLQRKVWRQAAALDALNRRVVTQRFVLRTLDELGRSLTATEYWAARARVANAALRDRIEDPDAA